MLGLSIFLEGLVNRNHISRFTQLNQARNLSKYSPVVVPVEISLIDDIANPLPNGIIDQQPAEQGLLCLDGVRWQPQRGHYGIVRLALSFTHKTSAIGKHRPLSA
jgi:hypothetical protein